MSNFERSRVAHTGSTIKEELMHQNFGIFVEQTNVFNQIFVPLATRMLSHIKQAGLPVFLLPNIQTFTGTKIIYGSHSNPQFWLKHSNKNDIFVNFEPVYIQSWAKKNAGYCNLLREHAVIDYSVRNKDHCGMATVLPVPPQFKCKTSFTAFFSLKNLQCL